MASIREILKGYVQKKALQRSKSINERGNQIISSREIPVSPVQLAEKREATSTCNIFSHQTTSLPNISANLVPLSTRKDRKKKALKNITSMNEQRNQMISSSKRSASSVEPEKRKALSAPNMLSHQSTSLPITPASLVPLLGEICSHTDVQGTPSTKQVINDDLGQNRGTSSAFNMVSRQTTLLPLTQAYPVPSCKDTYSKEEVMKINIGSEQGTASNVNMLTSNQCNVLHRDGGNQNVKSRCANKIQEKMPVPEYFRDVQLITQKETYPTEEVRSSACQSRVFNSKPLTKTANHERDLSRYHSSRNTDISPTTILTYPMSNQYPLPFYQMSASEIIVVDPFDTQNGSPERTPCYGIGTIMTPPPDLKDSHKTLIPHHLGTVQETTKSQTGDFAKNTGINQPEISSSVSVLYSHDQQRKQHFQNQINGKTTDLCNTSTCQCCDLAQSTQSQSSQPLAFGLTKRRPSVIMVPTSWSKTSSSSSDSHVPLKDDSDSTDEDEIEEKYFRANIDGKTARFKLRREDWAKIPIKKFPSGGRLLSGDWTKIFLSKVKESNPWCNLRFHNNHVRAEHSRKIHSAAFFRGSAECRRPECKVKVRFVIQKEKGKYVDVTYVGNVCHNSQPSRIGLRNIKNTLL